MTEDNWIHWTTQFGITAKGRFRAADSTSNPKTTSDKTRQIRCGYTFSEPQSLPSNDDSGTMRILFTIMCLSMPLAANAQDADFSEVIAKVADHEITKGELELLSVKRGIKTLTPKVEKELVRQLQERYLVDRFLRQKRMRFDRKALRRQVEMTRNQLTQSGADPDQLLKRIGIEKRDLEKLLEPPLRWKAYLEKTITDELMVSEFRKNKIRYDGTRLKVSQILIKANRTDQTARAKAKSKLGELRKRIGSSSTRFAEIARQESDAPSKEQGGDVGWITLTGKLPTPVAEAAFGLKDGVVSQPIESPFGVHLVIVTERKAGTLSPEDARPTIMKKLAKAEWSRIVDSQKRNR